MTIFSLQKFHQKAKNPRKRPIVSKFDVPKVPELYESQHSQDSRQAGELGSRPGSRPGSRFPAGGFPPGSPWEN
jgi:hypothetical protein